MRKDFTLLFFVLLHVGFVNASESPIESDFSKENGSEEKDKDQRIEIIEDTVEPVDEIKNIESFEDFNRLSGRINSYESNNSLGDPKQTVSGLQWKLKLKMSEQDDGNLVKVLQGRELEHSVLSSYLHEKNEKKKNIGFSNSNDRNILQMFSGVLNEAHNITNKQNQDSIINITKKNQDLEQEVEDKQDEIDLQKKTIRNKNRGLLAYFGCNNTVAILNAAGGFVNIGLLIYTTVRGCN